MAIIIPDSALGDRAYGINAGEKYLLNKLKEALPDDAYVWHNLDLPNHYQPDVTAYIPRLGIVIFEVKDWKKETIVGISPDFWTIVCDGQRKQVRSPLEQVRSYYFELAGLFRSKRVLLREDGNYKGTFRLPIAHVVAFTNIRRKDVPAEMSAHLDGSKFLFRDELEPLGNSVKGKELERVLRNLFAQAFWPNEPLTEDELTVMRGALYPEITLTKQDKGGPKRIILDITQEQMAKKVDSGHTIVRGIAGSGKSLVLCAKAKIIAETHPDWRTLIVCFNNSLRSQLDHYLKNLNDIFITKPAKPNWEIASFHSFVYKLGRQLGYKDLPANLFGHDGAACDEEESCTVLGRHLEKIAALPGAPRYDAILIDESQDFHHAWLKGLLCLMNPATNFLILAEDPNQKIYPRNFTYKEAGINIVGKVRKLPVAYRSTREIIFPATLLVQNSDHDEFFKQYVGEDNFNTLFKEAGGNPPEVVIVPHALAGRFIAESITEDIKKGLAYSDIAIICPQKQHTQKFHEILERYKIPSYWLVRDNEAKRNFDASADTVVVTTVHSAKGLEFEKVYFMDVDSLPMKYLNERENASIVYVAMTRAKRALTIVGGSKTETVSRISETIKKYCAECD